MSTELAKATPVVSEADIKVNLAALATIADDDAQWAEVKPDYGIVVDFEKVGDSFIGLLVSRKEVEQPDMNDTTYKAEHRAQATRMATVYEFQGTDGERYSIWGSYSIDLKLGDLPDLTPMRIEYRGKREFTDKATGAPRVVASYKVQLPIGTR